jgi:hypothetical protein
MALTSQLSEVVKAATTEKINDVVDFVDWIVERLSQLNYAMVLSVVLFGLAVGTIRSRRRLALVQKQLDKLAHDVRQLEVRESRRLLEAAHSRYRSQSLTQQQDAPAMISPMETGAG